MTGSEASTREPKVPWTVIALSLGILLAIAGPSAARSNLYEVHGVKEGDMLKMRAGIGTGYRVVLGLPNGTRVRVSTCEASGSVQWCKVTLKEFASVSGWVSMSYLREAK